MIIYEKCLIFILFFGLFFVNRLSAQDRENYILKVYYFENEADQELTDDFLKNNYLPAVKKHINKPIGVFKNHLGEKDTTLRTYVLMATDDVMKILNWEEVYFSTFNSSHTARYKRVEQIILKAFEFMPNMNSAPDFATHRSERIYELRSYESPDEVLHLNKVDMFNAGGEIEIFDDLGFHAVFYGQVLSGSKMPNLMYMTTFENKSSRDQHWKAFGEDERWNILKGLEKYKKNVSHIDTYFLFPTIYSDY